MYSTVALRRVSVMTSKLYQTFSSLATTCPIPSLWPTDTVVNPLEGNHQDQNLCMLSTFLHWFFPIFFGIPTTKKHRLIQVSPHHYVLKTPMKGPWPSGRSGEKKPVCHWSISHPSRQVLRKTCILWLSLMEKWYLECVLDRMIELMMNSECWHYDIFIVIWYRRGWKGYLEDLHFFGQ